MLTDAQVQAHADRIRGDGFTVIESAAKAELVEGLITALQRIEREHHLGPAKTSFEGFKTFRINNLLTYDDLREEGEDGGGEGVMVATAWPRGSIGDASHRPRTRGVAALLTVRV
jgi:hypothetical protein